MTTTPRSAAIAGSVEFGLLGPLSVRVAGAPVVIRAAKVRIVAAAMLVQPHRVVSLHELADYLWGDSPPPGLRNAVQTYVVRLRKALGPAAHLVRTEPAGYRIDATGCTVDLQVFQDHLARARAARAGRDTETESGALHQALALWRDRPLLDVPSPTLQLREVPPLVEAWLQATERRIDLDLEFGQDGDLVSELRELTTEHPLREHFRGQLMLALYRLGRQAEALEIYTDVSSLLREELGLDPGEPLRELHRRILVADKGLAKPPSGASTGRRPASTPFQVPPDLPDFTGRAELASAAVVVPFQLPADTVRFTGRTEYLARLLDLRPHPDRSDESGGPATVVVTAVEGMAGIGKTALAVHAAHRLADRFCDGVLFTDLRGFTPEAEPTAPEHALDHLLRGLGVPGSQIPPDLEARVGLYRSVLAHRRVLIVLDNAADETQLGPLLPATPGCRTIITSRRHLAGLDDAAHLVLRVLDPVEAADLFHGLAGDRVTPADQPTVERIVALCGRLPLAIRITAARLRQAPTGSPATLCAELADALGAESGLNWLSDGHRAISTALAVSYRHLTADQRHALRLAGLHPGPSIEPYALAALADTTVDQARALLDQLHAASVLDQPAYRRYDLHDLVAVYASTRAADLAEPDRQAALDRLYDHYAATSTRAMNLAYPWEADERPCPPATHTPAPTLTVGDQAQAWLDTETDNLLAAAHHAATGHRADHTVHQSATLRRHLRTRGHYSRAALLHQQALASARHIGNHHAAQDALTGVGYVHYIEGRHGAAIECFEEALASARQTGNHAAVHQALRGLGDVHLLQGRYGPAAECLEQALACARRTGNHTAAEALRGLGAVHYAQGRYPAATDYFERALASARSTGNHTAEQNALRGLGQVHYLQRRYGAAVECLEPALAGARQTGTRICEQDALRGLGYIHYAQGRYGPATDCFEQALDVARQIGDRNGQCEAHQGLGRVRRATDHYLHALHHQQTALQLALDLDQPADQARAHDGLADTHHALGDADQARYHWQAALDLLISIGTDHTEEPDLTTATIRTHLHDLDKAPLR